MGGVAPSAKPVVRSGAMSNSWLPEKFLVPDRFALGDDYHLRLARAADAPLSYPAVMSAQKRLWKQYGAQWDWPAVTLTLEQERAYLEDDERRARQREGFAYAVFPTDERQIVGFVYVERPMFEQAGDADVLMSWWLTDKFADSPLKQRIADLVPRWLRSEWSRCRPQWGVSIDAGI